MRCDMSDFDMRECPRCKHRLHWHRVYSDGEWAVCVGAPGCGCTYAIETVWEQ